MAGQQGQEQEATVGGVCPLRLTLCCSRCIASILQGRDLPPSPPPQPHFHGRILIRSDVAGGKACVRWRRAKVSPPDFPATNCTAKALQVPWRQHSRARFPSHPALSPTSRTVWYRMCTSLRCTIDVERHRSLCQSDGSIRLATVAFVCSSPGLGDEGATHATAWHM